MTLQPSSPSPPSHCHFLIRSVITSCHNITMASSLVALFSGLSCFQSLQTWNSHVAACGWYPFSELQPWKHKPLPCQTPLGLISYIFCCNPPPTLSPLSASARSTFLVSLSMQPCSCLRTFTNTDISYLGGLLLLATW